MVGVIDPQNKLIQGKSVSLDVAALHSDDLNDPEELNAHVINLDGKYMDINEFMATFYSFGHLFFHMNSLSKNDNISFQHQTINNERFILTEIILQLYQQDLNGSIDPSSHIKLVKHLSGYKYLYDLYLRHCSLSLPHIIDSILNKTRSSFAETFGSNIEKRYHHFIINARFTNTNYTQFKDIIVKFNFIVCFEGETFISDIIERYGIVL